MTNVPPKVRACLFDMDGLLIDSERVYTESTNVFLASYGKGPLPLEIKAQLMGRPAPHASKVLLDWAGLDLAPEEVYGKLSQLQESMWSNLKPLPGADILIQKLVAYNIPIALATSSHRTKFAQKTTHLQENFFSHFPSHRIVVGDDPRIPLGRGKPHGGIFYHVLTKEDIYLLALSTINESLPDGENRISPEECLVFEDAVLGVESARNAGMQVVWVPDPWIKGVFQGKEPEILGHWGREAKTLAHVSLEEYGIGADS